mmetsp:Transcript_45938/g.107170  ORF Transcript_45938/g.107170 Transcript_45938/m.107170 type:complete len:290 (-) Transcript_45938:2-871(-)
MKLEHILDEGERGVRRREGGHHLAGVGFQANRVQPRNDEALRSRDKAHQTNHRQATVVQLDVELAGLLLLRERLGVTERVEQVEREQLEGAVGFGAVEAWVVAWLAAAHVVLGAILIESVRVLAPELRDADGKDDLRFGPCRRRIPHIRRRKALDRRVVECGSERQRPVNAVLVDTITNEAGHGNTAVLDFRVPKKADALRFARAKNAQTGEVERVPVSDHRVEPLRQLSELRLLEHGQARAHSMLRSMDGHREGSALSAALKERQERGHPQRHRERRPEKLRPIRPQG